MKSGQILLNGDMLRAGQSPSGRLGDGQNVDPREEDDSVKSGVPGGKKSGNLGGLGGKKSGNLGEQEDLVLHVDLIKAKDLIKADMIGKSDPYAVLKCGNQTDKTKVVNNSQNPQWDHCSDFNVDLGDSPSLM